MRLNLFTKLFVVQLVAAAVLVGTAIGVLRFSTGQNFADYLKARDLAAFSEMAVEIGARYKDSADLSTAAEGVRGLRMRRPPELGFAPPPPAFAPSPPDDRGPRRGDPPLPPAFLLDAAGQPLDGRRPWEGRRIERVPIEADGKVVGYLAWPAFGPPKPADARFRRQQERAYLVIGGATIGLAALVAALLAQLATRPIRRLSSATAALARRDFSVRLTESRSDELGELARDVNRLAESLKGYDDRQRQWLADIAHELRNPLAVLRAQLEAVFDGVRPADLATMRLLHDEVARLTVLVEDLHLLSLADSGGLRLESVPTDLGEVARSSAARYEARFLAAGFGFRSVIPEGDHEISADPQRIERVVANLLENALRYATPPGPVVLKVTAAASAVTLAVSDAGPGVPAAALPRLFDRLYRVDPARTAAPGEPASGLRSAAPSSRPTAASSRPGAAPPAGWKCCAHLRRRGRRERAGTDRGG